MTTSRSSVVKLTQLAVLVVLTVACAEMSKESTAAWFDSIS